MVPIPTDVGRQSPNCYYWLHTHQITGDDGVVQQAEQSGQAIPPFMVTPPSGLQPYTDDPRQISLYPYELVYLMYGQQVPLQPWSFLGGE